LYIKEDTKCFKTLGPGGNVIKLFLFVIHEFSWLACVSVPVNFSSLANKHSSLRRKFVKYVRKKFYNAGPWGGIHNQSYDYLTTILKALTTED